MSYLKNCNSISKSKKKVNLNIVSFEDIKKKIDNINEDFKEIQNRSKSKERKQNIYEIYSSNSFKKIGNFPFLNTDKINFRNEFSKKKQIKENKGNLQYNNNKGGICFHFTKNKNNILSDFLDIENIEKDNNINSQNEKCIIRTPHFSEILKYK
jgi:hypothetical protein